MVLPLVLAAALASGVASRQVNATVTVDAGQVEATIGTEAMGLAIAVWDDHMTDPAVPALIKDAGFSILRYPGGSYADIYHWQTHSVTKGLDATVRSDTGFDRFMTVAKSAGATPLITVNYGSNQDGTGGADPAEAAAWVRYANRTRHYAVKYWEIGNEVYGNGFYNGQGWEEDLHAPDTHKSADRFKNPKLGPEEYGRNVNSFVKAMKGEDPSVKVGAVLCCPGGWPDRVDPDWNSTVLRLCGDKIDFVAVHWYGEGKSPAEILARPLEIPKMVERLKADIAANCGANASNVKIWMTEGDASGFNTKLPGGLFASDDLLTWWESGASHVDWWNLHNGAVKTFDGTLDDQGILSNGSSVGNLKEPPANTPFPPYYGVQLVSKMVRPGDALVGCRSSLPTLKVHAARRRDGRIGLLLTNDDPTQAVQVTVSVQGASIGGRAVRFDFGENTSGIQRSGFGKVGETITVSVPAFTSSLLLVPASKGR